MTAEVKGLRRSLAAVADDSGDGGGELYLRELLSKWRRHTESVTAVRDMVMYMERTFVATSRKVLPIRELGVKLWRDAVVCSGDVMPRLVKPVRHARAAAEPGDVVMAGVDKMLVELGNDVYWQVMDASSRQIKVEPYYHRKMDADLTASSCKKVTDAIRETYAQGTENLSMEELYRGAYNLVLNKHGELLYSEVETAMAVEVDGLGRHAYDLVIRKHGELLYSKVETAVTAEAEGLCRSLVAVAVAADGNDDGEFLRELLSMWRRHTEAVASVRDMVMYMERTFVVNYHKVPIGDLGVKIWRDSVVCSGDVLPRLVGAVRRWQGAAEPSDVMAGVAKMLAELGDDVYHQISFSLIDEQNEPQ
uniref:Cullin N-terminal domain-containing protein n=1 Tax=Leersia perrieri TaxID=77586 RepID=A0A0D9WA77_9ORYZ